MVGETHCLHRFCYDSKVNYWLRTQLPYHGNRFVDGFREQQMRLVASYHGVSDKSEVQSNWADVYEWYERATLGDERLKVFCTAILSKKSYNDFF